MTVREQSARIFALTVLGALAAGTVACSRSQAGPASLVDAEGERMRDRGRALFFGRAGCNTCHRIGEDGTQIVGPNLGVGDGETVLVALRERVPGVRGIEYVVESIVDPDAFVVPGYPRGKMRAYEEPPISLGDEEIVALAAFVAGYGEGAPPIDAVALARARARVSVARRARDARLTEESAPSK